MTAPSTANDELPGAIRAALRSRFGCRIDTLEIAGAPVLSRLAQAIAQGRLIADGNGHMTLPTLSDGPHANWIYHRSAHNPRGHYPPCWFLKGCLFEIAYGEAVVPIGCSNCYKVKVQVDTIVELTAIRDISGQIPCHSKCGPEVCSVFNQSRWSAIFYVDGLEMALDIQQRLEPLIDRHPKLNDSVKISIKRGCTEFEIAVGPSDRWRFDPALRDFEQALLPLFVHPAKTKVQKFATYLRWIETAFGIGDDSYLELTGGKRPFPELVDYTKYENPQEALGRRSRPGSRES